MSDFVDLETNITQTVAMAFDDGKLVETRYGDKMFFTLVDGRCLSLKPEAALPLHELGVRRNQPFCICKREKKNDKGKKFSVIDIWLPGDGETQPAQPTEAACQMCGFVACLCGKPGTVAPQSQTEADLLRSLAEVQRRKAEASVSAPAPVAVPNGTSTTRNGNGSSNGNGKSYEAAGIPAPATKIPYDIAFRELLKIVVDSLKEAGEQWSDAAKQDALSTLLIQASRDGFLSCWQRGAK